MEQHLCSEGIEAEIESDYWLSEGNVDSWEKRYRLIDRGKIGSQKVYRKEVPNDKQLSIYSVALNIFEQFNLEGAEIPEAKIEETQGVHYLVTECVNGKVNELDRDEAYDFSSLMVLLGDIEWRSGYNVRMNDDPVLIDLEFVGEYRIRCGENYKEELKTWFEERGHKFVEERFYENIKKHAQNLPEPQEVSRILTEETKTENDRQRKFQQEIIQNIEEALETARKGELTIDYISTEISDEE